MNTVNEQNNNAINEMQEKRRYKIAVSIIWPSMAFLFIIASITIFFTSWDTEMIYSSILPLLGTWMGAVIAFYFSKDNLESAQRTVENLVSKVQSTEEKLRGILTKEVMISESRIASFIYEKDKSDSDYSVKDLLNKIEKNEKNRLPIINYDGSIRYIVHRSILDKFLTNSIMALNKDPDQGSIETTIESLLTKNIEIQRLFNAFAIVKEEDTLETAKRFMETKYSCLDIFVNKKGDVNEPITGWVTNLEISENSKI